MTEEITTDNATSNGDVEMKEETTAETSPLHDLEQSMQLDPTDPNPPPQPVVAVAAPSDITNAANPSPAPQPPPAAATPPVASMTSARPGSMPPQPSARPEKPVAHGGPVRQYLNTNVTPHLLEGMKYLAAHEPERPLNWLADFLRERSREVEGT